MGEEQTRAFPMRRQFLALLGFTALVAGLVPRRVRASSTLDMLSARPIRQPEPTDERAFIDRAFEMRDLARRHGDQAFGAVLVKDNRIIGQSWSRVVLDDDPTGHAEMSSLRDAARRGGHHILDGATLYSTSHPCSMCESAAAWVGISRMVYGEDVTDAGAPRSC